MSDDLGEWVERETARCAHEVTAWIERETTRCAIVTENFVRQHGAVSVSEVLWPSLERHVKVLVDAGDYTGHLVKLMNNVVGRVSSLLLSDPKITALGGGRFAWLDGPTVLEVVPRALYVLRERPRTLAGLLTQLRPTFPHERDNFPDTNYSRMMHRVLLVEAALLRLLRDGDIIKVSNRYQTGDVHKCPTCNGTGYARSKR